MAARGPAGAHLHPQCMVGTSDDQIASGHLLEVALQAEIGVAHRQEFRVNGSVGGVANCAPLARGFMFENVWSSLAGVAAETTFVGGE